MYYNDSQQNQQLLCHFSTRMGLAIAPDLCYTQELTWLCRKHTAQCRARKRFMLLSLWDFHDHTPCWPQTYAPESALSANDRHVGGNAGELWVHARRSAA